APTDEARARRLNAGVDGPLMIKAIGNGSGGAAQFSSRAPGMGERRVTPVQGSAGTLAHYCDMIADFADSIGVATPLLDCVVPLYRRCVEMGLGDKDVAAMVEVISALPVAERGNE